MHDEDDEDDNPGKKTLETIWRCETCHATGFVKGKTCPTCDGKPFDGPPAQPRCLLPCTYTDDAPDAACQFCFNVRPKKK